jgi:hypothetical protein
MPMTMEFSGVKEINRELALLDEAVRNNATRIAVRAAATVIANEEKLTAPILDHRTSESTALEPEALKNGITFSVRKIKDGMIMAVIGPGELTSQVAHLVEYGHLLVKDGTVRVGPRGPVGSGKIIGVVKAHPWLRPAFETTWREAISVFADALREQLGKWVK